MGNDSATGGDPPSVPPATPPAAPAVTPPAAPPTGAGGTSAVIDPTGTGGGAPASAIDEKKVRQEGFDTGYGRGIDKGRLAVMDELAAKGLSPERIDQLQELEKKQKEAETKRAEDEGRWKELAETREAEHKAELAKRDVETALLRKQQQDFQIQQRLSTAVALAKVTPQAAPQVTQLLASRVRVDENGQTVVVGDDGTTVMYDAATASPVTVEAFVASYVAANPHFQAAVNPNGGSGGSGSPPAATPTTANPTAPVDKADRLTKKPLNLIKAGLDAREKK